MSLLEAFSRSSVGKFLLSPGPSDDFWYTTDPGTGYGGSRTASGVYVNESNFLNYSVCWAATRLLAGTAGWLPFNLHKTMTGGGANVDFGHPVHRLIHGRPNRDMVAMMFRAMMVGHQINAGNCFSEIVRTAGGTPVDLEPIHPRRIPPQNIRREDDGRLTYLVNRPSGVGQPQRLRQDEVFHVPSVISEDGIIGKGVVTAAREAIGKAIGTQRFGAASMKNGGAPPFAIKGGKFRSKEDREDYRRQYKEAHGSPEKAGLPLLLPEGSDAQVLGFSLEDLQFIESQQFDIEEMCRWYGVPPHLVGHLLRATFNNIEELGISFVKYSLIQWLKLWEQEVWRKLLTQREQETHYAKFNVDALERGNLATRTDAGVKKFFNGLWTLNQWAEQEDMNPITETAVVDGQTVSLGDMHFVQQAMIPLAQAAKGPPEPAPAVEPAAEDEPEDREGNLSITIQENLATLTATVNTLAAAVQSGMDQQRQQIDSLDGRLAEHREHFEDFAAAMRDRTDNLQEAFLGNRHEISRVAESLERVSGHTERSTAVQSQLAGALVRDVLARLLSVEVHNVKNIAQTASKFDKRLLEFYDRHRQTMATALLSPYGAALAAAGKSVEPVAVVTSYVDGHVAESMQQLLGVCDCTGDELHAKVEERVSKWHEERLTVTL